MGLLVSRRGETVDPGEDLLDCDLRKGKDLWQGSTWLRGEAGVVLKVTAAVSRGGALRVDAHLTSPHTSMPC
eukprot:353082-Chlamydomonas_euryale.AAC.10